MAKADQAYLFLREQVGKLIHREGWPLYLHGPPGHGKTCFAALLYASADGYGPKGSLWYSCRKMLGQLAAGRVNSESFVEELCPDGSFQSVDYFTAWTHLRTVGLVVIDDLGATPLTQVQSGLLCEILDMRQGLMTLVTGNLSKRQLEEVGADGRLVSRLCSGTVFQMVLKDRRAKPEYGVNGGQGA